VQRVTGIAAGTHSIVITVTSATSASNQVGIWAVGTVPNLPYSGQDQVFDGGVIRQQSDANAAATLAYNNDSQADAALVAADGLT